MSHILNWHFLDKIADRPWAVCQDYTDFLNRLFDGSRTFEMGEIFNEPAPRREPVMNPPTENYPIHFEIRKAPTTVFGATIGRVDGWKGLITDLSWPGMYFASDGDPADLEQRSIQLYILAHDLLHLFAAGVGGEVYTIANHPEFSAYGRFMRPNLDDVYWGRIVDGIPWLLDWWDDPLFRRSENPKLSRLSKRICELGFRIDAQHDLHAFYPPAATKIEVAGHPDSFTEIVSDENRFQNSGFFFGLRTLYPIALIDLQYAKLVKGEDKIVVPAAIDAPIPPPKPEDPKPEVEFPTDRWGIVGGVNYPDGTAAFKIRTKYPFMSLQSRRDGELTWHLERTFQEPGNYLHRITNLFEMGTMNWMVV